MLEKTVAAVKDFFTRSSAKALTAQTFYQPFPSIGGGYSSSLFETLTEDRILSSSAAWRALKLIGESVARVEKYVQRREGDNWIRDDDHTLARLMHYPADYYSEVAFYETMSAFLLLYGNAYAHIRRNPKTGEALALMMLHPHNVHIQYEGVDYAEESDVTVGWMGRHYYKVVVPGMPGNLPIDPFDMIHITSMNTEFPHVMGKNAMYVHRDNYRLGDNARKTALDFYDSGAFLQGYIWTPDDLSADEAREYFYEFQAAVKAGGSNFATPVLHSGMEYRPLKLSPRDSLFVEIANLSKGDISRIFGVPIHMLGDPSTTTFSNVEQMSYEFQEYTVEPLILRFASEFQRKLVPIRKRNTVKIAFDSHIIRQGDFESRAGYYTKLFSVGALSSNDIRRREGFNPREGGNTYFTPVNVFSDEERATREAKNQAQIESIEAESEGQETEALDLTERPKESETSGEVTTSVQGATTEI